MEYFTLCSPIRLSLLLHLTVKHLHLTGLHILMFDMSLCHDIVESKRMGRTQIEDKLVLVRGLGCPVSSGMVLISVGKAGGPMPLTHQTLIFIYFRVIAG